MSDPATYKDQYIYNRTQAKLFKERAAASRKMEAVYKERRMWLERLKQQDHTNEYRNAATQYADEAKRIKETFLQ